MCKWKPLINGDIDTLPKKNTWVVVTNRWYKIEYDKKLKYSKLYWETYASGIIAWTQLPTNHKEFMFNKYPMGDIYKL